MVFLFFLADAKKKLILGADSKYWNIFGNSELVLFTSFPIISLKNRCVIVPSFLRVSFESLLGRTIPSLPFVVKSHVKSCLVRAQGDEFVFSNFEVLFSKVVQVPRVSTRMKRHHSNCEFWFSILSLFEAEPVENCLESIRGISGVEEIRRLDGSRTVELKVTLGKDVRPDVAEAVIRSGAKLYSLSYSEDLLERTYLEALKKGTNF